MRQSVLISGGKPLSGTIELSGNKNAVLPMIAAAILTPEPLILRNVPDIRDVHGMCACIRALGGKAQLENGVLSLCTAKLNTSILPDALCHAIRTSVLCAGPLLARLGRAQIGPPGGDCIGRRRLDTHVYGLTKLGAVLESADVPYVFSTKGLVGQELFFDEASVTATEHILLTAVLAEGTTIIRNAAAEPHVRNLGEMLEAMGARISGLGTNTLTVQGVSRLHGVDHRVIADHIEAGSFLCAAAATGGELHILGAQPGLFWMQRRVLERFGIKIELHPDEIYLPGNQTIRIAPDFGNAIPVVADGPWPQYASDMMPPTLVLATQAQGTVLFFEKMFESRIYFVDRLIAMGANAIVCDPHRAVISGPAALRGLELTAPDIRAGMALVIAALCAKGKTLLHNTPMISRGYENWVEKFCSLGAEIESLSV